jgi:hypothetical protein
VFYDDELEISITDNKNALSKLLLFDFLSSGVELRPMVHRMKPAKVIDAIEKEIHGLKFDLVLDSLLLNRLGW